MPNSVSNNNNNNNSNGAQESPSSSLERNMKPSDFALLRQKSSDQLDVKLHGDGRRATMLDEYNKKLKTDSNIEAIKKAASPTTSSFGKATPPPQPPISQLGKSPTGSLSKSIYAARTSGSPTFQGRESSGSAANAGSKESLSSTPGGGGPGVISERVSEAGGGRELKGFEFILNSVADQELRIDFLSEL